ncbi:MAG TPA: TRAP transporter large permease [Alphaproteobacteria bacterium]|nr:TRAP transporter large permease [Alphaproteobacteria bacterium]
MDFIAINLIGLGVMFVLLALGMPIGFALGVVGLVGSVIIIGSEPAFSMLGQTAFETVVTHELSVVPLFILMGYFATSSGLSEMLFRACNTWLGHRRGGLALATIGGCGSFAAICGSSLATAATMTQVALPEMRRYGYDERLATGAIAAGGTIGILIPPSVILVLYGILTETSIAELFAAGIIPGILTIAGFMVTVSIVTRINPKLGPRGPKTTIVEKLRALWSVLLTLVLFLLVIGGIYTGAFTPTEAAGIGAVGAFVLTLAAGRMTSKVLVSCLTETVKTTAMIFTILIGAIMLNKFLTLGGLAGALGDFVVALNLSKQLTIIVILLIYFVLGCALDSLAMILLTIPIFFPIATAIGVDPVWFGVIVVMVVEMGLISPPIGMNVFIIKGMAPDIALSQIYRGVLPFVIAQMILIALLVAFPVIATWLPSTM